eukprot:1375676-Amorphochlora_amoeboformis.AAC.1
MGMDTVSDEQMYDDHAHVYAWTTCACMETVSDEHMYHDDTHGHARTQLVMSISHHDALVHGNSEHMYDDHTNVNAWKRLAM